MKKVEKKGTITKRQVLAMDRALARVRDTKNPMGMVIPGCTFSTAIMYLNAWNHLHIKDEIEAIQEAVKPMRKKYKDNKDKWLKNGIEDFLKEEGEFLNGIADGIKPKRYSMKDLGEIDEARFIKANENTPVPQEYISSLMEAGILDE